jgi:hypothetical protein
MYRKVDHMDLQMIDTMLGNTKVKTEHLPTLGRSTNYAGQIQRYRFRENVGDCETS